MSQKNLSLAHFWEQYCPRLNYVTKKEKSEFQKSDWSARPLSPAQLDYASNDTYFLMQIASQQIQQAKRSETEVYNWFQRLSDRVKQVTYTPLSRKFDPATTYKKPLRVNCDFYDPKSDQYLLVEYMFSEMYNERERCA